MKTTYLLITLLFGSCIQSFSQAIEAGDKRRDWGWQPQGSVNFLGFSSERGVADNITIGFGIMVNGTSEEFFDERYFNANLLPTIKGNYYFTELLNLDEDKIDVYGGLGVSKLLNFNNFLDEFEFNGDFPVGIQLNAGGRYFISDRFGFKGELNLGRNGLSNTTIGLFVSFKK